MSNLEKISLSKLVFNETCSKKNIEKDKQLYALSDCDDGKQMEIILKNVTVPFGYESYDKKTILNIEINPDKNNDHHNIYSLLAEFERGLSDKKIKDKSIKNNISEKEYHSNMRKSEFGYIIRGIIQTNTNLFATINGFKTPITSQDLPKTKCNVTLGLSLLWISKSHYGISWNVKSVELLGSCPNKK